MGRRRSDDPDGHVPVLLLATADEERRRELRAALARGSAGARGGRPARAHRFRVVIAASAADALRRAGRGVSVAAVDLALPGGPGREVVRRLRETRPDLPILAFGFSSATSDAIAAVMAGADFFHECVSPSCNGFVQAIELANDRRRLTSTIQRSEAEVEAARGKLAQLSGELVRAVPGFRPLDGKGDVVPFREAARAYLLSATQLFEGDPRGLARALGVSYFALRRLLVRYEVPFPAARPRR
jgi:DNA-binding NarL/FixJ family response regulator